MGMKKARRQARQRNNHLAKLGRPGFPKKYSKEASAKRLQRVLAGIAERARRKGAGKG